MIDIIKKNISSFASCKKEQAVKLCLYFSGNIESSFLLKTLLRETKHQICLYYINKKKYAPNSQLSEEEVDKEELSKEKIIKFFNDGHKNLICRELEIFQDEMSSASDMEDIHAHVSILDKIYDLFGGFDAYIIPFPPERLKKQFDLFDLYTRRQSLRHQAEFVFPFLSVESFGFYAELISNLFHYIINYDRIYNDNKDLIEALIKNDKRQDIDDFITYNTDFNVIFRYFVAKRYTRCSFILDNYGDQITPKLYKFSLLHHIPWHYSNQRLISLCVNKGEITNEELNSTLISFVSQFDSKETGTTDVRLKRLDYFFRLFEHKISDETMDILMRRTQWQNWQNTRLLDKLAELGGDVGQLMIYCLRMFFNNKKKLEERVGYLLDHHVEKIHELQLNEALILAFRHKSYELCRKLIEKGADENTIRFHKISYGMAKFKSEYPAFLSNRNYWRSKDIIVVKQILKHLGNPHKRVPPVIHVTGSNGKGSTCAYLRAILEQEGRKVHMFTSPALVRGNENFIISSEEIPDEMYYRYLAKAAAAYIKASKTEEFKLLIEEAEKKDQVKGQKTSKDGVLHWSVMIPAAILGFAENQADATIIEVITGGEKDLTNVFDEKVTAATIVNTIIFGDNHVATWKNIEDAAETKSKLCKNEGLLICGKQESDVFNVVKQVCEDRNCQIVAADNHDWHIEHSGDKYIVNYDEYKVSLQSGVIPGQYQLGNLAMAYVTLLAQNKIPVPKEKLQVGLNKDLNILGRIKRINRDRNYGPFIEKHIPEKVNVFLGTVKERYGMSDFVSYMKQNFPDYPAHFVVNIPSVSERVLSILDILWNSGLNIKSIVIFDNLKGKDRDILRRRLTSLGFSSKIKINIKTSLSGALASSLSILKEEGIRESVFTILTAGIQIFPRIILYLLYSARLNPNYLPDLEFALENLVLKDEEIDFYTLGEAPKLLKRS